MIYTAQKGKPFVKLRLLSFFEGVRVPATICPMARLQATRVRSSITACAEKRMPRTARAAAPAGQAAAYDDEEEDDEAGLVQALPL